MIRTWVATISRTLAFALMAIALILSAVAFTLVWGPTEAFFNMVVWTLSIWLGGAIAGAIAFLAWQSPYEREETAARVSQRHARGLKSHQRPRTARRTS